MKKQLNAFTGTSPSEKAQDQIFVYKNLSFSHAAGNAGTGKNLST